MGRVYPNFKNRLYHVASHDGIRVIRVLTYVTANKGVARRTANYVFYMIMAVLTAPFVGKVDVVLSTSPQFFNGLAGYFVSRLKRVPWILEIRDLWPASIHSVGAIKANAVTALLRRLEVFAYRKADRIVALTRSFKTHIAACGCPPEKIEILPNGVNLETFRVDQDAAALARRYDTAGKFVAAYFGTHGMAHGLGVILEAARRLKDREDILFLMVGDGAEKDNLVARCAELRLDNVRMLDQQPKEVIRELWALADVSLVLLRKLDVFQTVVPSKIFEAMAARSAIILGVAGECKELIEQAKSGICIEPESVDELVAAILWCLENPDKREELGRNGRDYVEKHYDRSVLAGRYLEIIRSTASPR